MGIKFYLKFLRKIDNVIKKYIVRQKKFQCFKFTIFSSEECFLITTYTKIQVRGLLLGRGIFSNIHILQTHNKTLEL